MRNLIIAAAVLSSVVVGAVPRAALAAQPPAAVQSAAAPLPGLERARALLRTPDAAELLALLAQPEVRAALAAGAPAVPAMPPASLLHVPRTRTVDALAAFRLHLVDSLSDVSRIPPAVVDAAQWLHHAAPQGDIPGLIAILVAFAIGGATLERAFRRGCADWRGRLGVLALDGTRPRALAFAQRLVYSLALLASFAVGSIGTYLFFDWPGAWGIAAISLLTCFLAIRLASALSGFLLAPSWPRFRLLAVPSTAAPALHRWVIGFAAAMAICWQGGHAIEALSGDPRAAHAFRCILAGVSVLAAWAALPLRSRRSRAKGGVLLAWAVAVWALGSAGEGQVAWMLALAAAFPAALFTADQMTSSIVVDAPGSAAREGWEALVGRTFRATAILSAACALAWIWGVNPIFASLSPDPTVRNVAGATEAVLILLFADLAWQVLAVTVDGRITSLWSPDPSVSDDEGRRRARIRTVVPVFRNMSLFAICCLGAMGALSAIGLEIGPLLAGAGIVGISVGFGAQALVRDVISGFFFLLDDAFRVGEIVESGLLKGEVTSFTLRSVRLRDESGKLHTIPFGELKSVTNHSRDWSGGEISVHLHHGADMAAFETAMAESCAVLEADPLIAPLLVLPPRSLGISAIAESSLKVSITMRTRPGHHIEARALLLRTLSAKLAAAGVAMGADRAVMMNTRREALPAHVPLAVP